MPSPEFIHRPGSIWEAYSLQGKTLAQIRGDMETIMMRVFHPARGVRWEAGVCGGVPGKWVYPPGPSDGTILYFHGGGYALGSSGITLPFLAELAKPLHLNAFSADYRLAPEHPFPAAPEDCLAAYRGLLEKGVRPENIILCGDCVGATLCLALVHMLKAVHIPGPRAVVALSPRVDCTTPASVKAREVPDGLEDVLKTCAPDADPTDPRLSPLLGDLTDFCPVFLIAGGGEPLCRDSLRMATALAEAGNEVKLLIGRDMLRAYPLDFTDYPEAAEAFAEISAYLRIKFSIDE